MDDLTPGREVDIMSSERLHALRIAFESFGSPSVSLSREQAASLLSTLLQNVTVSESTYLIPRHIAQALVTAALKNYPNICEHCGKECAESTCSQFCADQRTAAQHARVPVPKHIRTNFKANVIVRGAVAVSPTGDYNA